MKLFHKWMFTAGFFGLLMAPTFVAAVVPYQDDNRAGVRAVDGFEYADTLSGPLANGWVIKAGTGTAVCSTLVPAQLDTKRNCFATFSSSQGLAFLVQYPPDSSEIKSKRPNFSFSFRATDSFAVEAKVLVRWAIDSTRYYILKYKPGSGANYQQDSITLVFYLGAGCLDGQWHYVVRDFNFDVHAFFPSKNLDYLSRVFVRGNVSVESFVTFNRHQWIEGYGSQSSVAQGGTINFQVSLGDSAGITDPPSAAAKIEIYRFGATTDLVTTITGLSVTKQDIVNADNGLNQNWPVTASWVVPQSAKSGVYMARFVITAIHGPGIGKYTYCPFVVKEDSGGSKSKILFKVSDNTWQAYNYWGGQTLNYLGMSHKVSYNRPYLEVNYYCGHRTYQCPVDRIQSCMKDSIYGDREDSCILEDDLNPNSPYDSLGAGQFFVWEYPQIQWLESHNYVVEYCDDIDLENWKKNSEGGAQDTLEFYNLLISSGHDEYWTERARVIIQDLFRNKSNPKSTSYPPPASDPRSPTHNLAFLSGNNVFYKVVYDPTIRLITYDPSNPFLVDPLKNRGIITGLHYWDGNVRGAPYSLTDTGKVHWVMRNAGFAQSDFTFGSGQGSGHSTLYSGIAGYEIDWHDCTTNFYPDSLISCASGLKILAQASGNSAEVGYYDWPQPGTGSSNPTRSRVLTAGGIQWAWALNDPDGRTSAITKNLMDGLGATVRGNITQNTTWRGPVYFGGDVTIDSGVTVTAAPGTKFFVFPNNDVERTGGDTTKTRLIIKGTFNCSGTLTDSIIFTLASTSPANGDWGGLFFETSGGGTLEFVRISYADTAIRAKSGSGTVTARNCTFNKFKSIAVYSQRSSVNLGKTTISPPDCGKNNILMKSASSNAKAVTNAASSGTLYASGNWWDTTSVPSSWFSGNVNKDWVFSGPATPDSCPNDFNNGPSQGGGDPKVAVVPLKFELSQNYPNPFNPTTTIRYSILNAAKVELKIYNMLGQMVKTLVNQDQSPGFYEVPWDGTDQFGRNVSSGIYFYQIKAGDFVEKKKMQLIK